MAIITPDQDGCTKNTASLHSVFGTRGTLGALALNQFANTHQTASPISEQSLFGFEHLPKTSSSKALSKKAFSFGMPVETCRWVSATWIWIHYQAKTTFSLNLTVSYEVCFDKNPVRDSISVELKPNHQESRQGLHVLIELNFAGTMPSQFADCLAVPFGQCNCFHMRYLRHRSYDYHFLPIFHP